ncbi:DNA polymerase IV [Bdellovibrionota bacterium FG-1]
MVLSMIGGRKIIHVDMDAFFASVEQRDHPELRGRPVIVGGDPHGRGVVAACSYEARKFGVHSAMSSAKAYRLCPQAVVVHPHFSVYQEASEQIHKIFEEVTDQIEPLSLDEAYLDVTVNKLSEPLARKIAAHLRARIQEVTGLTASAGVGPNKFIAKIASDLRKPDGLVVVPPERVMEFIERLPVERLWGVGPATAKTLHELGLFLVSDIRKRPLAEMERSLGKFGTFLHQLSHGQDDREVESEWEPKSSGTETTFEKDVRDTHFLLETLNDQAEDIVVHLRKLDRRAKTVALKLRYSDFTTITRSRTLWHYTDDPMLIADTAQQLLTQSTEAGHRPVRLIGITMSNLIHPNEPEQLWLDLRYTSGLAVG